MSLLVLVHCVGASLAGCQATASTGGGDAAVDAAIDAPPDSAPPAPRCDPGQPFGAPAPVAGINVAQRDVQAVLVDELTMYWTSDRAGSPDLYVATRASPASPFANPIPLDAINSPGIEIASFLTGDGLTMYYAYVPVGQTNGDLYVSTRAALTAEFPRGTSVPALNTMYDDSDPSVTADGVYVYFASSRPGTGDYDIYVAARRGDGSFEAPQLVPELNTARYDAHPRVSADGLTMYFSSMRTDGGAQGGTDIWVATRASTPAAFGAPARVPELNTTFNESPTWIAPDGCSIYLQTDRPGGAGGQDIWEAKKPMTGGEP